VYIDEDPEFQNNWKKWSGWTIKFCQEFLDFYWADSLRKNPPHKATLKQKFLNTEFPYDIFMKVEKRKDMDLFQHLCDFIFCQHHGVKIEIVINFLF